MPDRFTNPQFYAEDAYFYEKALLWGFRSLAMPYAGYLQLIPRFVAWLAVWLPPRYAPLIFNVAAFLIAMLVIGRIFSPRTSLSVKPLVALSVVLFPHADDLFMTLENIQWVASLALVLLLVSSDATDARQRTNDYAAILLSGLTGVFSILFAPLFIFRAALRRTRESGVVAGMVAAVALVQSGFVIQGGGPLPTGHPVPFDPGLVMPIFGYRLIAQIFGGTLLIQLSSVVLGFAGLLAFASLAGMVFNPRLNSAERRTKAVICAVIFPVTAAAFYRFRDMQPVFLSGEHLARYFFIPQLAIMWLIAAEIPLRGIRRFLSIAALAAYLITCACFFRVPPLVDFQWKDYAHLIRSGQHYDIPVNPPGWHFRYVGKGM
jgi:uncharacterized membrane protein YuzA (DUF378 family)